MDKRSIDQDYSFSAFSRKEHLNQQPQQQQQQQQKALKTKTKTVMIFLNLY